MRDHVILCGYGQVGYRVAPLLRRLGLDLTVLYDSAPADWIAEAEAAGIRCLQGDARSPARLEAAGIATARALVAATDRDLVNLSIALDARRLNPGLAIVLRLYDPHLAPHIGRMLDVRGPFSTTAIAAQVVVARTLGRGVVECFLLDGRPVVIAEAGDGPAREGEGVVELVSAADGRVRIASGERRTGAPADTLVLRHAGAAPASERRVRAGRWSLRSALATLPTGLRVVLAGLGAIVVLSVFVFSVGLHLSLVDALYFVATTVTTVGYGDVNLLGAPAGLKLYGTLLMLAGAALLATLFGIVTDFVISSRLRDVVAAGAQPPGGHVIVAGWGHIGRRVTEALRAVGQEVVVVARGAREEHPLAREPMVVEGDARERETLQRAGVESAHAVIALADDDVLNLGVAALARQLSPGTKLVTRVFDSDLGRKMESGLGIDHVFSVTAVAAPMLAAACLYPDVVEAFVWRDHLIVGRQRGDTASGEPAPPPRGVADERAFALERREGRLVITARAAATGPALVVSVLPLADGPAPPPS